MGVRLFTAVQQGGPVPPWTDAPPAGLIVQKVVIAYTLHTWENMLY